MSDRPAPASAAPSPPSASATAFRADVQGLRGVAVLLVVLFHADGLLPGGFVGVDVFFVISGFVIGRVLLAELDRRGTVDLGRFFARRARRLLPALALTTVVTLLAVVFLLPAGELTRAVVSTAAAAALFVANLQLYRSSGYFAPDAEENPLLHTWSLSVEEQFYLALPVLVVLCALVARRRGWSPRIAVVVAVGLVSAVSLGLSWWVTGAAPGGGDQSLAFYAPFTRAWEFGAGILLAAAAITSSAGTTIQAARARTDRVLAVLAVVGLALVGLASVGYDGTTAFPGLAAVAPVAGALLLVAGGAAGGPITRLLTARPLVWVGDRSYGWYLWHWPAIVFARVLWPEQPGAVLAAAVASLALAGLSYRLVEEPFRQARVLVGPRALGLATACVALPLVVAFAVGGLNRMVPAQLDPELLGAGAVYEPSQQETRALDDAPGATERGGTGSQTPTPPDEAGAGRPRAVLVGDSHALALADGLVPALEAEGFAAEVLAQAGCPFLVGPTRPRGDCPPWQAEALRTLLADPPDVVVVHGYTTGRVTRLNSGEEGELRMADEDGTVARDEAEALALYEEGLGGALRALTDAGAGVVVVSTVPDYPRAPFADMSVGDAVAGGGSAQGETVPREDAVARNAPVLAVERSLAAEIDGVEVVDPVEVLCDPDTCAQIDERDDTVLYRDTDHLSPLGAARVGAVAAAAAARVVDAEQVGAD